jgi:nitrogen fixation NifU-like protein
VVVDAAFDGHGCAISQATASMLMEEVIGKSLDAKSRPSTRSTSWKCWGSRLGPVRLKCALLPLKVLKAGAYGLEEWPE